MANNKKFNIDEYNHIGYENYDSYLEYYYEDIDIAISNDTNKYLKALINEYNIIIDDVQEIFDIHSKSTMQKKVVPILKSKGCLYIVKPVRDLIYAYMGESQYIDSYRRCTNGFCDLDFESDTHKENIELIQKYKLKKNWLRKRLFFTEEALRQSTLELFSKEVIDFESDEKVIKYDTLTSEDIDIIIENKVLSENKIKEIFGLTNGLQVKRRINKNEIKLIFRVAMVNEGSRAPLIRYSINA